MRKVFLENLPKRGKFIDWNNSIGYKISFIYDKIEEEIEIIDYDNKTGYLTIKYKNNIDTIYNGNFKKCKLGKILNLYTSDFKIEIGTIFKDEKRDIIIIDRKYKLDKDGVRRKYYKYHCNADENEDWILESCLLKGVGCNVCTNQKVMLGVNTIWDKAKWMISLGVSEEDAKTYMPQSNKKIEAICPYCGKHKTNTPNNIYRLKSIGCTCGDGNSYPNKFIIKLCEQLLKQGQIKHFETEYKIKDKRYDIFVTLNNGKTLIIENHGGQHGEFIYSGNLLLIKNVNGFSNLNNRNDIEEDIYKCRLAYENNIDNYIQLDCTISDIDYIERSIKNTILSNMFDLTEVDWMKCHKYALKNIVKEVCDYWHEHREINKEEITTINLCKIFNLNKSTIIDYLKKGTKLGWCNYTGSKKTILMYDKNMNLIGEYESSHWLDRVSVEKFGIKLNYSSIASVCRGEKPQYKGYIFRYAD